MQQRYFIIVNDITYSRLLLDSSFLIKICFCKIYWQIYLRKADMSKKQEDVFEPIAKPKHALDFYLVNPNPEICDTSQINMGDYLDKQMAPFFDLIR